MRSLRYTVTVLFQRSNNEVLVSAFLEDAEDLAESIFADFVLFFEGVGAPQSFQRRTIIHSFIHDDDDDDDENRNNKHRHNNNNNRHHLHHHTRNNHNNHNNDNHNNN